MLMLAASDALPALVTSGIPVLSAGPVCAGFVLLATAIGRRLLRLLGAASGATPWERGALAFALGAGALQFVPFALGAAGVLTVPAVWSCFAVLSALSAFDMVYLVRAGVRALRERSAQPAWLYAWAVSLAPALASAALCALTPTSDPDGLGYHLTVPKRWLDSHTLRYLPTYTNSNMPMGLEMLFTSAAAIGGDASAKAVHLTLATVGALGLFAAGKRVGGKALGALVVSAYLVGPFGVSFWIGQAMVEGAACLATITATLAWLLWFESREKGWLRVAFLLAGIGVSFKITAGLFPVALLALTWVCWRGDQRLRPADFFQMPLLSLGALAALPVLPWLLRAAYVTGNPVYPLAVGLIPSRDFTPDLAEQWHRFNLYWNWAIRVGASWSLAKRKLILVGVGLGIASLGGAVCLRQPPGRARGITLVVTAVALAQLAQVGLYLRYWVPLMAVLMLPALWLARRALADRRFQFGIVALSAVLSLRQARRNLTLEGNHAGQIVRAATGLESQRTFLLSELALFPLYEQANRELPPDASIFMVGYCSGFYVDRSTLCGDIVQGSIRLIGWDEFTSDLRTLKVTHLFAPLKLAQDNIPEAPTEAVSGGVGVMVAARTNALVNQLLRQHGVLIGTAADTGLYRVDWSERR